MTTHKKVDFIATKYKDRPTKVNFYTKTGERVFFEAAKKMPIKERVQFYVKRGRR